MSDIFISYSGKDVPWVRNFAKVLEAKQWSVWWDRHIPTGQSFDAVIEEELQKAKCVIVIWSQHSVRSDWVKTEAAKARQRQILLPVSIEGIDLPLEFSRLQTPSLVTWKEGQPHPGFDRLLQDITRVLGSSVHLPIAAYQARLSDVPKYALVSLPTAIVLITVIVLMTWNLPTHVLIELVGDRVEFIVDSGPAYMRHIVDSLHVRSLTIEKFSSISMTPELLKVADPSQYRLKEDSFPASAWRPLVLESAKIALKVPDNSRLPKVTLEPRSDDRTSELRVEPIMVEEGTKIVLEARGLQNEALTIKVSARRPLTFSMPRQFETIAEHIEVDGVKERLFQTSGELTYRVRLSESDRTIEVDGHGEGPVISVRFPLSMTVRLLPPNQTIHVSMLSFERQNEAGDRASALTGAGKVQYPDYPELGSVQIKPPDVIDIAKLKSFYISEVTLDPEYRGLRIVGEGVVDSLVRKRGGMTKDCRMTAFDVLWHNPRWMVLLGILGWFVPTAVAGYHLIRS